MAKDEKRVTTEVTEDTWRGECVSPSEKSQRDSVRCCKNPVCRAHHGGNTREHAARVMNRVMENFGLRDGFPTNTITIGRQMLTLRLLAPT